MMVEERRSAAATRRRRPSLAAGNRFDQRGSDKFGEESRVSEAHSRPRSSREGGCRQLYQLS